ncbi:hypothetical protein GIB67_028565, partial [Kingdonia uniflora]
NRSCRRFNSVIESIRKEVVNIARRRLDYNLQQEGPTSSRVEETRRDHGVSRPFVEEHDVIGIEENVEHLEKLLLTKDPEQHRQRKIFSLVAMEVPERPHLLKKFTIMCWQDLITAHGSTYPKTSAQGISYNPCLKGFARAERSLLQSMQRTYPYQSQEKIFTYLRHKRYLLVLDDTWDAIVWEKVKHAIPLQASGRIIFTTRNMNVALPIGKTSYIQQLKPLSDEQAWDLFCRKAFKNSNIFGCCPQDLKSTGEGIVRRCVGLPLALVVKDRGN